MRRRRSASLFICAALIGASSSPGRTSPGAGPAPTVKRATQSEVIKALTEEDRDWLTRFVAPIILAPEKKAFLELAEPHEREAFKEEFWKRREQAGLPPPLGPGYRHRYAELRRLVETEYDRWPNDAARMVIRHGEPASVDALETCRRTFRDLEIWTYDDLRSSGAARRRYLFYRRSPPEPRRMWTLGTPDGEVFSPRSCRKSFQELNKECVRRPGRNEDDPCGTGTGEGGSVCAEVCDVFEVWVEISSRQGSTLGAQGESARTLEPAQVPLEGLGAIRRGSAGSSDPSAAPIRIEGPAGGNERAARASTPTATPEARRELSRAEVLERVGRLEPKYRAWLDLAAPLLTQPELSEFLQLSTGEKDEFIRAFWKRHS